MIDSLPLTRVENSANGSNSGSLLLPSSNACVIPALSKPRVMISLFSPEVTWS